MLWRPIRWIPEFVKLGASRFRGRVRLLGSAVLVGIVAGLGAVAFFLATLAVAHAALGGVVGYHPASPAGEVAPDWLEALSAPFRPWLLLVVPALGGIVSGLLLWLAPEAEGHGTDAVISAYHNEDGYIRPRVPIVKMIASAITIGTGGSGGREGPIAQIGAGFGSFLGNILRMRPADRRVLTAAGMGAGIAAIFRAPLAGALFASEVLYSSPEFEPEVIIPAGIASVVSYCTFGAFLGWRPLFATPDLRFSNPLELGPYLLLTLLMVALAFVYTRVFGITTDAFRRSRVPKHLRPAVGALSSGALALALYSLLRQTDVLAVLSFGYGALQGALEGKATVSVLVLAAIALGKILTTSLTIGSGGSGGVFGPSMVIGGCAGGALGTVLHRAWPELVPHPASFVVVGMAGFFAAAAKTPFSTLVIVSEMTGGYHLLLPALWVCTLSFLLSDAQTIYGSQLETRAQSPAHKGAFARRLFDGARISQFLVPGAVTTVLDAGAPLDVVLRKFAEAGSPVLPVVDSAGRLLGIVNLDEVHLASQTPDLRPLIVAADLMRADVAPLTPDDRLDHAQELFVEMDLLALPVVDDLATRKLLGMAKRYDVASAYVRSVAGRTGSMPDVPRQPSAPAREEVPSRHGVSKGHA
jgi:CIC family chloride channel protein